MDAMERLIMRVAWLQHYGWDLEAIRAEVLPECDGEGLFFLIFQAAVLVNDT